MAAELNRVKLRPTHILEVGFRVTEGGLVFIHAVHFLTSKSTAGIGKIHQAKRNTYLLTHKPDKKSS